MKKSFIETPNAPAAFGPYSQAVLCDNVLYLSGVLGIEPASGALREGLAAQIHQLFANMRGVVEAAGGTMADIVKLLVILVDINDAPAVNEIMNEYFVAPFPARATFQVVALPKGARVEVDSTAVLGRKPA
jgi:reactive intermediate/imine deaminase